MGNVLNEVMTQETTTADHRWYVLRVIGGRERRVRDAIEAEVQRLGVSDFVPNALVPVARVYQIRKGKKVTRERVLFTGYVFVEALLTGEIPQIVKNVPEVLGFLTDAAGSPSPLSEEEVQRLLGRADEENEGYDYPETPYSVGDEVRVIDGPFSTFSGVISRVDEEKKKVEIMVKIFDRSTPVELSFMQVEKE